MPGAHTAGGKQNERSFLPARIPVPEKQLNEYSQAVPTANGAGRIQRTLLCTFWESDSSPIQPDFLEWVRVGLDAEPERLCASGVAPKAGGPRPEDEEEREEDPARLLGEHRQGCRLVGHEGGFRRREEREWVVSGEKWKRRRLKNGWWSAEGERRCTREGLRGGEGRKNGGRGREAYMGGGGDPAGGQEDRMGFGRRDQRKHPSRALSVPPAGPVSSRLPARNVPRASFRCASSTVPVATRRRAVRCKRVRSPVENRRRGHAPGMRACAASLEPQRRSRGHT